MNFFNIGKANARIAELEAELATSKENAAAVEKTAEGLQTKLTAAEQTISTERALAEKAESGLKAAEERATKAEAAATKATEAQKDFDAKVKAEAEKVGATKAAAIVAEVTVPPVKTAAADNPAKADEKSKLTGLAKYQSAIKEQVSKLK